MRARSALLALVASLSVALATCGGTPPTPAATSGNPTAANRSTTTASPTSALPSVVASPTAVSPSPRTVTTPAPATSPPPASVADGERIFQTGLGPNGQPIARTGGIAGGYGMMGGQGYGMMGGPGYGMIGGAGCAACHGPQGQGFSAPLFTAPNISYANLTNPKGMVEPDGSRGPTYTDTEIARAVATGIDAEGQPLDQTMPRRQMAPQQMADLLAYLKTLP